MTIWGHVYAEGAGGTWSGAIPPGYKGARVQLRWGTQSWETQTDGIGEFDFYHVDPKGVYEVNLLVPAGFMTASENPVPYVPVVRTPAGQMAQPTVFFIITCQVPATCPRSGAPSVVLKARQAGAFAQPFQPRSVTVPTGSSVDLDWYSSPDTTCVASGGWNGPQSPEGTARMGPLRTTQAYGIRCRNAVSEASDNIVVEIVSSAP